MKHEREKENLIKSHETQKTTLLAEIDKVCMLFFSQIRLSTIRKNTIDIRAINLRQ